MFILKIEFIAGIIYLASAMGNNKDLRIVLEINISESHRCYFPEVFDATVNKNGSLRTLRFQKIVTGLDYIVAYTYLEDHGAQERHSKDTDFKDVQLYTDKRLQSTIELSCINDKQARFTAQGVVTLPNGDTYSIESGANDAGDSNREKNNIYPLRSIPPFKGTVSDKTVLVAEDEIFSQPKKPLHLQKRDTSAVYIDVLVLVGYSVYQRWLQRSTENTTLEKMMDAREQINRHFALLFNSVDLRFKTVASNYNIKLVGVYIEDRGESEWVKSTKVNLGGNGTAVYGEQLLNTVWNWTSRASGLPRHDVTVAYEFLTMYSENDGNQQISVSYETSICNDNVNKPVTVVSYLDLIAYDIRNTASGLAHGFGAKKDGPPNNCSSSDFYLMSSNSSSVFANNTYSFSPCSRSYIETYIENHLNSSNQSQSCLRETTDPVNVTDVMGQLPGEVYTPDEQCRQHYGAGSFYCHHKNDPMHENICRRMYCYLPGSNICYAKVAAEGTSCGNKTWCYAGECRHSDKAPTADAECVYMDQAQIGILEDSQSCPEYVASGRFYCYYTSYFVSCCKSCRDARSEDKACLYGDDLGRVANCSYEQCLTSINDTRYLSACCETCQNLTTTTQQTSKSTVTVVKSTRTTQQTSKPTVTEVSTSKTFKPVSKTTENIGLAVGLGVGLSLLVIIALLVILYFTVVKKNKIQPKESITET